MSRARRPQRESRSFEPPSRAPRNLGDERERGRGVDGGRHRLRRHLADTTLAASFCGLFPSAETFTESVLGLGAGLPFSNTAFSPNFATMRFLVSSPPVKSITNVGTRRALRSATHRLSST